MYIILYTVAAGRMVTQNYPLMYLLMFVFHRKDSTDEISLVIRSNTTAKRFHWTRNNTQYTVRL